MNLLSCLMGDTPLGQIIAIRSETDPEVIKHFSKEQKNLRNEWLSQRNSVQDEQDYAVAINQLFSMALA